MSYDDKRAYISFPLAAQNVIHTASNHVATSTLNATVFPIADATYLTSIAVVCTASSGNQVPVGLKLTLLQTNTTSLASISLGTSTLNQVNTAVLSPPVAVAAGTWLNIVYSGTGTASETRTASALNVVLGFGPQFT